MLTLSLLRTRLSTLRFQTQIFWHCQLPGANLKTEPDFSYICAWPLALIQPPNTTCLSVCGFTLVPWTRIFHKIWSSGRPPCILLTQFFPQMSIHSWPCHSFITSGWPPAKKSHHVLSPGTLQITPRPSFKLPCCSGHLILQAGAIFGLKFLGLCSRFTLRLQCQKKVPPALKCGSGPSTSALNTACADWSTAHLMNIYEHRISLVEGMFSEVHSSENRSLVEIDIWWRWYL